MGKEDAKRLRIMQLDMKGREQEVETLCCLQKVVREDAPQQGKVSGDNANMEKITGKWPKLFQGLGRAKVDPIHIEIQSCKCLKCLPHTFRSGSCILFKQCNSC